MKASYQGSSIRVQTLGDGFAELCFDREGESINKLDGRTMTQLAEAVATLAADAALRGVLITSAKDVFIVGADIHELGENGRESWGGRRGQDVENPEGAG